MKHRTFQIGSIGYMTTPLESVFSDVLKVDISTLNDATSPDNTPQWDSLAAMHLVVTLEEEYDVKLKTREIMQMRTIASAREVLKAKGVEF